MFGNESDLDEEEKDRMIGDQDAFGCDKEEKNDEVDNVIIDVVDNVVGNENDEGNKTKVYIIPAPITILFLLIFVSR